MSLTSQVKTTTTPLGRYMRAKFSRTAEIVKQVNRDYRGNPMLVPPPASWTSAEAGKAGTAADYRIRMLYAEYRWEDTIASRMLPLIRDQQEHLYDSLTQFEAVAAEAQEEEDRLCRICVVMAEMDLFMRIRLVSDFFQEREAASAQALLDQVNPEIAQDVAAQAAAYREAAETAGLLDGDCHLNPTFAGSLAVGGADAYLIVKGCLFNLKSSRKLEMAGLDIFQIIGYALLDYDNRYQITEAGIFHTRYGRLIRWPLPELLERCMTPSAPHDLAELRDEVKALLNGWEDY